MPANPDDFTEWSGGAARVGVRPPPGESQASLTVYGDGKPPRGRKPVRDVDKVLAQETFKCQYCSWSTIFANRVPEHERGCERDRAEFERRERESGGLSKGTVQEIVTQTMAPIVPLLQDISRALTMLVGPRPDAVPPVETHKPVKKDERPTPHRGKSFKARPKSHHRVERLDVPVDALPQEPTPPEPTA